MTGGVASLGGVTGAPRLRPRLCAVGLCLAAILPAVPASALVPPLPTCYAVEGPEAAFGGYEPTGVGNGFVIYGYYLQEEDAEVRVLEHCPTATQLALTLGAGGAANSDLAMVFDTMIYSETAYTMEQMRDALRGMGGDADLSQVDHESCACATFGK